MKLLTSIVDIDSIQVRSLSFNPEDKRNQIEALANTIVDLGALVYVPIVHKITIDDYEMVSGDLEYYAYLKAREINPNLPDRITVFVSNNKNHVAICQQVEMLKLIRDTQQNSSESATVNQTETNLQIKNLQTSVSNNVQQILNALVEHRADIIRAIDSKLPKPIPLLEAFNRILEPAIALKLQHKLEFLGEKKARKIVARLQEVSKHDDHKPFLSFTEISEILLEQQKNRSVRLITEKNMLKIIDRWND